MFSFFKNHLKSVHTHTQQKAVETEHIGLSCNSHSKHPSQWVPKCVQHGTRYKTVISYSSLLLRGVTCNKQRVLKPQGWDAFTYTQYRIYTTRYNKRGRGKHMYDLQTLCQE